jgi:hypothetical protein
MKTIKLLSSEDAVSEVVDFVTILGILMLSIGIIGVAGYPIVKNAQEANYIENTRQSFIMLAENVNKVVMGQAPLQSVELKMYGGSLSVTGNSIINITATVDGIENTPLMDEGRMRSIESTVGDTTIAYEGTGVWAKYPDGNTILVNKPLITNQSNVLVIPVVKIYGHSSIGGSGMSSVMVYGVPNIEFHPNVNNITVRIINSSYQDGWKNYFNTTLHWSKCPGGSSDDCIAQLNTTNNIDVYILEIPLHAEII